MCEYITKEECKSFVESLSDSEIKLFCMFQDRTAELEEKILQLIEHTRGVLEHHEDSNVRIAKRLEELAMIRSWAAEAFRKA